LSWFLIPIGEDQFPDTVRPIPLAELGRKLTTDPIEEFPIFGEVVPQQPSKQPDSPVFDLAPFCSGTSAESRDLRVELVFFTDEFIKTLFRWFSWGHVISFCVLNNMRAELEKW